MSRRKDRERAESGIIFRDGKLVDKEEYYAAHPTRGMRAAQQASVDAAVVEVMATKPNTPYFCTKCEQRHVKGRLYNSHLGYAFKELIAKEA